MCTTGCRQCTVQNGCHTGLRQSRCMCTTGCFQSVVQNGGHTGLRHILCTSVPNIWKVPWSIFLAGFLGSGSGQIVGHKSLEQIFQAPCLEEKNPWSNRTSLERYPALIFPGIEHACHKFFTRKTTPKKRGTGNCNQLVSLSCLRFPFVDSHQSSNHKRIRKIVANRWQPPSSENC